MSSDWYFSGITKNGLPEVQGRRFFRTFWHFDWHFDRLGGHLSFPSWRIIHSFVQLQLQFGNLALRFVCLSWNAWKGPFNSHDIFRLSFWLRSVSNMDINFQKSRSKNAIWFTLIWQIVLLLRLVPLLPFNMLNYLLSVTPVSIWEYMLASWLGMMVSFTLSLYIYTYLPTYTPPSQLPLGQSLFHGLPCDIDMVVVCRWCLFTRTIFISW